MRFGGIAVVLVMIAVPALGREFYLSTTGTDALDAGTTSVTAWRTFPFALSQLQPGDVLNVENGLWTSDDGGVLDALCDGVKARPGNADAGITVRSVHERGAHIRSDGRTPAAKIENCHYWTLDGLLFESEDSPLDAGPVYANVHVLYSDFVTLKRLLVWKDNRYPNTGLILISHSDHDLVEECEMYDYVRNGLLIWQSDGTTVRRCYANSRGREALDSGFPTTTPRISNYDYGDNGTQTLFENCIAEGSFSGFQSLSYDRATGGRFFGLISLARPNGVSFFGNPDGGGSQDNWVQDLLAVRPRYFGVLWKDMLDSHCVRCSILDAQQTGLSAAESPRAGRQSSAFVSQTLVTGMAGSVGLQIDMQGQWQASDVNAYGFATPFFPTPHVNFVRTHTDDPMLDSCLVMIPAGSPMKGKALDGGDIGANILYRYQDGVLTNTPLWGPSFPCGAQVAGVNDDSGVSCSGVHQRLGVDTCAFPPHYLPVDAGVDVVNDGGIDGGVADAGVEPLSLRFRSSGCSGVAGFPTLLALLVYAQNASRRRSRGK